MNRVMAVQNRADALRAGQKRFQGDNCTVTMKHVTDGGTVRYVSSGRCCACEKDRVDKFRLKQQPEPQPEQIEPDASF